MASVQTLKAHKAGAPMTRQASSPVIDLERLQCHCRVQRPEAPARVPPAVLPPHLLRRLLRPLRPLRTLRQLQPAAAGPAAAAVPIAAAVAAAAARPPDLLLTPGGVVGKQFGRLSPAHHVHQAAQIDNGLPEVARLRVLEQAQAGQGDGLGVCRAVGVAGLGILPKGE